MRTRRIFWEFGIHLLIAMLSLRRSLYFSSRASSCPALLPCPDFLPVALFCCKTRDSVHTHEAL